MNIKIIALTLFSLLIIGCEGIAPYKNSRVNMVDERQNYPYQLTNVQNASNHNGFLEVQVQGFNKNKSQDLLEYRVDWLDNRGFVILTHTNNRWFEFSIFRSQNFTINLTAPSIKAVDFRVYIRDSKDNSYNVYNSQNKEEL